MVFNPDKCSTLRILRSRKPVNARYTLKGLSLEIEDSSEYLGVELQSNLTWNGHIDQIVKKGNRMLGFLRRNLKVCNQDTKAAAYFSLVRQG